MVRFNVSRVKADGMINVTLVVVVGGVGVAGVACAVVTISDVDVVDSDDDDDDDDACVKPLPWPSSFFKHGNLVVTSSMSTQPKTRNRKCAGTFLGVFFKGCMNRSFFDSN